VSPEEFIPIAEHTGLIIPLGQFILTESLRMVTHWQAIYGNDFRIAVNLSPRQFRDPNLIGFIRQSLQTSGVSAETVELEITEGVLMSGHSFIDEALRDLSNLGIRLAMDDFGTGYSSLSYLRRYSFDTLKIDRSFIKDIAVSTASQVTEKLEWQAHQHSGRGSTVSGGALSRPALSLRHPAASHP
jgi:EAL domain-containing protein (putative c-di-GMP-specific phosphodiesterase class I)